jgi:hypothetical protein
MNTLTKLALGLMGQLRPQEPLGDAAHTMKLPAARKRAGLPLMEALRRRESQREFAPQALPNRCCPTCSGPRRGSTAPSSAGARRRAR